MALVDFMTEADKAQSWERRKEAVVAKLAGATRTETALVIADKGCNLRDMLRAAATSQASVDSTNTQENLVAGVEARGNLGARGDAPAPVTLSSISVDLSPRAGGEHHLRSDKAPHAPQFVDDEVRAKPSHYQPRKARFGPVSVRPTLTVLSAHADDNRFRRRIATSIPRGTQGRSSLVVCHGQRPSSRGRRISCKRRQPPYAAMCPRDA